MTKALGRAKAQTKKPKSLRRGPDRRRQIIAAASELFARNGFEGTSIRDIAAGSGVLSGSLYYHFPSKEDLLFTVHQESLTAMRQEVETAIAGIKEPWKRLDEAIVAHCRILLGGSVTRAILTPPRYYHLKGVRKLVRQRDEVTDAPAPLTPHQRVLRVRFAPTALVQPSGVAWDEIGLAALAGQRVLAVSAVARPAPLYRALRDWEAELVHVLEYPDHHAYDTSDWQAIASAAKDVDLIVTTEKDLVKLEAFPFARGKLLALRLGVEVEDADGLVDAVIGDVPAADAS